MIILLSLQAEAMQAVAVVLLVLLPRALSLSSKGESVTVDVTADVTIAEFFLVSAGG